MAKNKKGFTLIELTLSITFLTTLAIIIAILVSNSAITYRKGVTIKNVNILGTEIIEDLRTSINNNHVGDMGIVCDDVYDDVAVRDECKSHGGFNFVSLRRTAPVTIKGGSTNYSAGEGGSEVPVYGAFCTGKYSYLWTSGYFFNSDLYQVTGIPAAPVFKYSYNGETKIITNYRLLKILDEKRQVCVSATNAYLTNSSGDPLYIQNIYGLTNNFDVSGGTPLIAEPIELIRNNTGEGLAIYDLYVARPAQTSVVRSTLYSGYFILGSIDGGVSIGTKSDFCKAYIDDGISEDEYCAVNRFNFSIQTSNI